MIRAFVLIFIASQLPEALVGGRGGQLHLEQVPLEVQQHEVQPHVTVVRNSNCRYRTYGNCRLRKVTVPVARVITCPHCDTQHTHDIHVRVPSRRITACPEGHILTPDQSHCKHIDCDRGLHFSDALLKCVDIDECVEHHPCLHDETCINSHGSYSCRKICTKAGYRLNEVSNTCEDIDECLDGTHLCGPQQICRNIPGGHDCQCPPGFRIIGRNCEDINECNEPHVCPAASSYCENTPGTYRCSCKIGFKDDGSDTNCLDINECLLNNGGCSHECVNKYGSYECSCEKGYTLAGDDRTCVDIDECSKYGATQLCQPETSRCVNTPGSYVCDCITGFRDDGTHKNCLDINECVEHTNLCQQKCFNTFGSYKCSCNKGYRLVDTHQCEDIDECHEGEHINSVAFSRFSTGRGKPQLCQGHCENTLGSYHCSCPHGYRLKNDYHCVDIDECREQDVCHGPHQTCVNTGGSFRCIQNECPPGYYRDAHQCKITERLVYAEICDDPHQKCDIDRVICYSYAYIPIRSNLARIAEGPYEFFTFIVPIEQPVIAEYSLRLASVKSPHHDVVAATRGDFHLRRTKDNEVTIALLRPLKGPQDVELEIEAKLFKNGLQIGKNVATVTCFVSQYEY